MFGLRGWGDGLGWGRRRGWEAAARRWCCGEGWMFGDGSGSRCLGKMIGGEAVRVGSS